ncbi:MAG: LysM peptidoglycan-binding domain-containing protein [Rhodanobacter sp.]|nr:MAG: LysM peptidoglycan-binding domain-containing protein [Rhodanobacter sp.]
MSVRLARLLCVLLFGVCLTTSAFARSTATHTKGGTLIWRGDVVTAHGVVDDMARAWQRAGHGRIELQPFNTASGIDAVVSGRADLAGSARGSDGSAEDAQLKFIPVAWDGLVIVTNAANPVRSLTLKQVHDIYYGLIHNWKQVGGRNAPIDVYAVASPGDGVEFSLRKLLFGRGNQPVAAPRLYLNTHQLEAGVQLNPNGMGAATLSDIRGNRKLKALAINGIAPTVANIADGSYPLYTPLYLVLNPRSPKAAKIEDFIEFVQSASGRAALRRNAVLPFQDGRALVRMDSARRSRILAEVGAQPSRIARTPAISAPGATYAAGAAMAPTSPHTLAARRALERRQARERAVAAAASQPARLNRVRGDVAGVTVSSLAHARGEATTVNAARASGRDFHQVSAEAYQGHPSSSAKTYKVARGDTLFSIARRHAVKVAQLRDWNHLRNNEVKLGQLLRVSRD